MNWPMPEKHASECWIHEGNCCDCGAGIANTMLAACKSSFEKQDNALFQEIIELKKDKQDLMSHLDSLRTEKQGKLVPLNEILIELKDLSHLNHDNLGSVKVQYRLQDLVNKYASIDRLGAPDGTK